MKKLIPILILAMSITLLAGCSGRNITPDDPARAADKGALEAYRQQLMKFANTENFVYSPISLNTALNIYQAYDPNNKTVNSLVGDKNYIGYKYQNDSYKSVNRIWVNSDKNIETPKDVKKFEHRISMSDSAKATREKNKYVEKNTNGFIKETPTVLNETIEYDIMNILYFKDTWKDGDLFVDPEPEKFNGVTDVNMMSASSEYYYENDTAYMIPIEYEHGNRMLLIYPKYNIEELDLSDIENNKEEVDAYIKFPPFSTELSFSPNDAYKDLPNQIQQTVKIEVNEKGTEAAAVTEDVKCTAEEPVNEPLVLTFDKPFMYAIEDTVNGDIAFIGKITTIQ